jgi:hypothetical protein
MHPHMAGFERHHAREREPARRELGARIRRRRAGAGVGAPSFRVQHREQGANDRHGDGNEARMLLRPGLSIRQAALRGVNP